MVPLAIGGLVASVALASDALASDALASKPDSPEIGMSFLSGRDATFDGARIRERRTGAALTFPERRMAGRAFGLAVRYDYSRFVYQGLATRNRDLHRLAIPLRWRQIDDGWDAELTPTVATSSNVFKDLPGRGGRRDIDLHGRLEYHVSPPRSLGWRAGLKRDAAFGEPRLYPVAAVTWHDPSWQVAFGFPSTWLTWQSPAGLRLGAAVFPDGNRWHVISDERDGASFDYRVRTWRAALSAGWEPSRRLRVELQAGLAFHRRHRFEDDLGMPIDRRASSARFWGVLLALRP